MSYRIRIASANGYYHVMNRGNNKLSIFDSTSTKNMMLRYFERAAKIEGFEILAYCIMPNHYHLLVKTEDLKILSKAMQQINLSYSRYYMKRHQYVGHVFQSRFSSCGINTREYLSRAIRYIHQNPVRGNLCNEAFDYYHSSFCEYAGRYTRNILPDNGLLILEELGFYDVLSFKKYHSQNPNDDLDGILLREDSLLLENNSFIKDFELEAAYELKASYGDYHLMSSPERLKFANLLLDSSTQLSKNVISKIAQIDRHRLNTC